MFMKTILSNTRNKWLFSKRKVYYNILKVMGLCSACFLFEACYGAPQNEEPPTYNMNFRGLVQSEDSLKPLPNIKIAISNIVDHDTFKTITDLNGVYSYNAEIDNFKLEWKIKANDIDDSLNGVFYEKETTFVFANGNNSNVKNTDLRLKRK